MKNPFQAWLESQALDSESQSLFAESFLCYQARAYRAALVFSYLGFLKIAACRFMAATKPDDIDEGLWGKMQESVRDEDHWEQNIGRVLDRSQPSSVFLLNDDLRLQIQYWRGRRNDCAHSRGNVIDAAHVESLWLFVRSNLARVVVSGGRAGLVERFKRHFDPGYTRPDRDFFHLVSDIPQAIRPTEYQAFLVELLGVMQVDKDIDDIIPLPGRFLGLIDDIMKLKDERLIGAVREQLKADRYVLLLALQSRPSLVMYFAEDPQFIRKLWYDLLPVAGSRYTWERDSAFLVFAVLLRNELVPLDERAEAIDHVVWKLNEGEPRSGYSTKVLTRLPRCPLRKGVWSGESGG